MSTTINKVKDGYLKAVQWVADHPHKTIWAAVAVIGAAVVL